MATTSMFNCLKLRDANISTVLEYIQTRGALIGMGVHIRHPMTARQRRLINLYGTIQIVSYALQQATMARKVMPEFRKLHPPGELFSPFLSVLFSPKDEDYNPGTCLSSRLYLPFHL